MHEYVDGIRKEEISQLHELAKLSRWDNNGTNYLGLCIIEVCENKPIKSSCGTKVNFLTTRDKEKLRNWSPEEDLYINDNYRMDFDNYLFIFEYCQMKCGYVLIGSLLERTKESRLDLLEIKQDYLMEQLAYV